MVYVISDGSGFVKIGYTEGSLELRLKTLQCGNPRSLKLIYTIPGSVELEHGLHCRYRQYRIKTDILDTCEWFDEKCLNDLVQLSADDFRRIERANGGIELSGDYEKWPKETGEKLPDCECKELKKLKNKIKRIERTMQKKDKDSCSEIDCLRKKLQAAENENRRLLGNLEKINRLIEDGNELADIKSRISSQMIHLIV